MYENDQTIQFENIIFNTKFKNLQKNKYFKNYQSHFLLKEHRYQKIFLYLLGVDGHVGKIVATSGHP